MPKLALDAIPWQTGSGYPAIFATLINGRQNRIVGDAGGLTQFGVVITTLKPGLWSSQRHWHESEDEFAMVLEGNLVMLDNDGEHPMQAGDVACFPAGDPNGHHFINRSGKNASFLVIGGRSQNDRVHFPDIDLLETTTPAGYVFTRKDGSPF